MLHSVKRADGTLLENVPDDFGVNDRSVYIRQATTPKKAFLNSITNKLPFLIPFGDYAKSWVTGEDVNIIEAYFPMARSNFYNSSYIEPNRSSGTYDSKTASIGKVITELRAASFVVDYSSGYTINLDSLDRGNASGYKDIIVSLKEHRVTLRVWAGGEVLPVENAWYLHHAIQNNKCLKHTSNQNIELLIKELETQMTTTAPTQTTKPADTAITPGFIAMAKKDFQKAGVRVAVDQMTKGIKSGLMMMFKDDGMSDEKAKMAVELLDHPMTESFLKLMIGYGGSFIPVSSLQNDKRFAMLAEEFRVSGQANGMNHVADRVMKYLVPAITAAVQSLPPMLGEENSMSNVRLATPSETDVAEQAEEEAIEQAKPKVAQAA
jgi:hypothetical protein